MEPLNEKVADFMMRLDLIAKHMFAAQFFV